MTPFKADYLSNPNAPIEPDIFELVGVLVHSGTAESGHYYSYIRERPTTSEPNASWVEFNDSDVTRFDPSKIADQCFGGDSFHGPNMGQMRFSKVWNAYMLFYQRVSSMENAKSVYRPSANGRPITVPLPLNLGNHISMENELFIRSYCLLDPYHAYFVRSLLEQSRRFTNTSGTAFGKIRESATLVALDSLEQLIARSKELPEVDGLLNELSLTITESPQGALTILQWTERRPYSIRNLLLKSPNNVIRTGFGRLLVSSLSRLQDQLVDETLPPEELTRVHQEFIEALEGVVITLDQLWNTLHVYSRAWDDYFGILLGIANLGPAQVEVLLDHGFLTKCLEIVWLDNEDVMKLRRQYLGYWRLLEKGRRFSQFKLIELLYALMSYVDLTLPPTLEGTQRTCPHGKFSLNNVEVDLVRPTGRINDTLLLKKIVEQQSNSPVCRQFVELFLHMDPECGFTEAICRMLEDGLRILPAVLSVPFLEGALVFCQSASDADLVSGLIDYVAKGVDSISDSAGREHLGFFQALTSVRNENIGKDEFWFWSLVIERIPDWAPTLLHYPDRTVKTTAFEFIRELVFSKEDEELSDDFRQFYTKVARELAQACVDRLRRHVLAKPSASDGRIADTITVVINHCLETYYDETESEQDADFIQQASSRSPFFFVKRRKEKES